MSEAHYFIYIWHELEAKIGISISFPGTANFALENQSLFIEETA